MAPTPKSWLIDFDADAVLDFEEVKSKSERKAVFNVVHKLKELGPDLPTPHMKSLKGETDLFELRPKQGASAVRPIYARAGSRFVILAIAPSKRGFDRAVAEARLRLDRRR
ncbi:MAG TPA: type II toxin-antitoxin system RelE/ParE family toxin [Solirubrobacterales bacterium]|nr:type II toxin-antitoxin system RelE/ParE family toxin [Solirubrobacterales bacterium]